MGPNLDRTHPGPPAADPAGELRLTPERRAVLEPKLAALLAELAHLEALAGPETEPDTAAPWDPEAGHGPITASPGGDR